MAEAAAPATGKRLWQIWVIAVREYLATVKTKTFVVALVLVPLLGGAMVTLPMLAHLASSREARVCAVVDRSHQLLPALLAAAQQRDAAAASSFWQERFVLQAVEPAADEEHQRLQLSDQVRAGQLSAFVEIDAGILTRQPEPGTGAVAGAARYYSSSPTSAHLRHWLERALHAEVSRHKLRHLGLEAEQVDRAQARVLVETAALATESPNVSASAGASAPRMPGSAPDPLQDFGVPVAAVMLMFTAVMLAATPLMQSTLEEKMERIAEVLVASVSPLQLLLGKLLGACAVSYTYLLVYLGGGSLLAAYAGFGPPISASVLLAILGFQAIALLTYGGVFLAVGSACNDLRSSQSLTMPAMLVLMAPLLLLQLVLDDPNGPPATVVSLVPVFTPILMLVRVAVPPGAPWPEVAVGLVLSGGVACLAIYVAARVFRVGMLTQGATPSYRELWRWIRSG